jgi:hypothetical protein
MYTNSCNKIFSFLGADLITSPDKDVVDCQIIHENSAIENKSTIDSNKLSRTHFWSKVTIF